ncbi:ADP-ribosylation factor-like protein 6-interacting protein 1 [Denticeps clupeoides]|uniref:RETREG1-3/ARL6IP-like N-terminal reticulon-homology domain-containing protein n=1 Tax=Denticeps clupeoides TaxID=299321 RepID=A0AAY4CR34_9TELE|nr:ADP-ribosylation factor-like protein 6-interacting protein 1 [Denticeps clupeoides]
MEDERSADVPDQGSDACARLEELLQPWGAALLSLDRLLLWRRKLLHPAALVASSSAFFLLLYYLDPPVLTGISCAVVVLCLVDYLMPILVSVLFGSNKWSSEQQLRFHEICLNLIRMCRCMKHCWDSLSNFKHRRPKTYFLTVISTLLLMAWIGQQFHNLLLSYFIVTFILLLPGVSMFVSKYTRMVTGIFRRGKKSN